MKEVCHGVCLLQNHEWIMIAIVFCPRIWKTEPGSSTVRSTWLLMAVSNISADSWNVSALHQISLVSSTPALMARFISQAYVDKCSYTRVAPIISPVRSDTCYQETSPSTCQSFMLGQAGFYPSRWMLYTPDLSRNTSNQPQFDIYHSYRVWMCIYVRSTLVRVYCRPQRIAKSRDVHIRKCIYMWVYLCIYTYIET